MTFEALWPTSGLLVMVTNRHKQESTVQRFSSAAVALFLWLAASTSLTAQDSLSFRSSSAFSATDTPRVLEVTEAFPYFFASDGTSARIDWQIAEGHYLYRHGFAVSFLSSPDAQPLPLTTQIPNGEKRSDQFFGEVEVYYQQTGIKVALPSDLAGGGFLLVEFQGCAAWGLCYPPQKDLLALP